MNVKITPEKLTAFCAALAETGQVAKAAKAIDVSRQTAYEWRREDEAFAARWDEAKEIAMKGLEDEAYRRAYDGVAQPVFHNGAEVGTMQKYSDTLAIFLLKAHDPKYRDHQRLDLGNADGKPFEVNDTERAARLASLVATAKQRAASGEPQGDEPDGSDGSDLL